MDQDSLKKMAAEHAVSYVKPEMIIGLGTGSTAKYAIEKIGELYRDSKLEGIKGIATSDWSQKLAEENLIPMTTLDNDPEIDITIDGADEVDSHLNLIKGGGGAHLREKIVAQATKKQIIVVDESKISEYLGEKWAVPVEIIEMAIQPVSLFIRKIGGNPKLRINKNNEPFRTDEGNLILDCDFGIIKKPEALSELLKTKAGIVEHGIFENMTDMVIIASAEGIKTLEKKK